jgi:hypothetical protein
MLTRNDVAAGKRPALGTKVNARAPTHCQAPGTAGVIWM